MSEYILVDRNNIDFKSKVQEEHHTGTSLLELIPNFDMIRDVPLDYMHLICLGVVRKLLVDLWCCGKPPYKLSSQQIAEVFHTLIEQSGNMPVEFCRKPRCLKEVKRSKATEFRQFLFYTGPVVLKLILYHDRYLNFMSLNVATTILANARLLQNMREYAQSLMTYFVVTFKKLYGKESVSHNIHNLLHISQDTTEFGIEDAFSAFPFENRMKCLKKHIRKGDNPLKQIINRIAEKDNHVSHVTENIKNNSDIKPGKEHFRGPLLPNSFCPQYETLKFRSFTLRIKEPDNCCMLKDKTILCIDNVATSAEGVVVLGKKFLCFDDFYEKPCKSSELHIYQGNMDLYRVGTLKKLHGNV